LQVGDKLREMLLNELSDNVDVFSAEEKAEFIFHLFRTLAVGGALCQPDSNLNWCDKRRFARLRWASQTQLVHIMTLYLCCRGTGIWT
jgi:hypothetical protein